jgi:hypothetical protein
MLSRTRVARVLWACYPLMVIFVVMATGNHYLLDAVAGVLVAAMGAGVAWGLGRLRPGAWAFRRGPEPVPVAEPAPQTATP